MALLTQAPKGTIDILPSETYKWNYVRNVIDKVCGIFGFKEIIIPTIEHTELFKRGVGETTDIVSKEMYTFDMSGRSLTLRPEGTAGTARAVLEHGLYSGVLPLRLYYILSCFRYEKPQAGRYREHYQFGVEIFGSPEPYADVEVIETASLLFDSLGIENISLEINSIGCPECRKDYHKALREYLKAHESELCGTCLNRLERNPMRVLDCKSPVCKNVVADAPVITDFLCGDCRTHFNGVQNSLKSINLDYKINPHIVRGQDYYTRTVFEFISNEIGAKDTVCGGGRYDGLISSLGGDSLPGLGFGLGINRLIMLMDKQGCSFGEQKICDIYIANMGQAASDKAVGMTFELRKAGLSAEMDVMGRSLKAQMKYANKIGAAFTLILGENELNSGKAVLKNMKTAEQREIVLENLAVELGTING